MKTEVERAKGSRTNTEMLIGSKFVQPQMASRTRNASRRPVDLIGRAWPPPPELFQLRGNELCIRIRERKWVYDNSLSQTYAGFRFRAITKNGNTVNNLLEITGTQYILAINYTKMISEWPQRVSKSWECRVTLMCVTVPVSHVYRVRSESECEQRDEAVDETLESRSASCARARPGLLFDQRAVAEPDAVAADASPPELAPLLLSRAAAANRQVCNEQRLNNVRT